MNSKHIVILLLGIMAFLMLSSSVFTSCTYDEWGHLVYGAKILHFDSSKTKSFEDSKMPFSAFNAVLYNFVKKVLNFYGKSLSKDIQNNISLWAGRLATIFFSLLLGLYVFKWSKDLYGVTAGIFSLFLYVFSPNIIAHSQLITTDLYAALMITISTFYFWRFVKFGGWKRAALSASILGLSQFAKYTCIWLYPIFLIIVLIRYSNTIFGLAIKKDTGELLKCFKVFIKYILLFSVVSILVINIGFLFNRSFTPLSKYEFESGPFKKIQSTPILKDIPLPIPYPYIKGLDMLKYHEDNALNFYNSYLMGKVKIKKDKHFEGFKGYFFYAFLFKEPLAIQLFILLALMTLVLNRKKHKLLEDELFLLLPILFFMVYFNYFFKTQIGIRHLLGIFPLLYVFCGNYFEGWKVFSFKLKSVTIFLLIYLMISTLSYFPHYLSYFNEIVWDRKQAYKLLADSNIDWGQNKWYLEEYMRKSPKAKFNPRVPTSGRIVVPVNDLVGVFDPERYRWLRENFEPVDSIAYSYLVYDISSEDLKKTLH